MIDKGVRVISLHDIVGAVSPRKSRSNSMVDALKSDIKRRGLLQPIIVCEDGRGKYTVIAGFRRYLACKELGLKKVTAKVYANLTQEEIILIQLSENIFREDFTVYDVYFLLKKLMDLKHDVSEVSGMTGLSREYVNSVFKSFEGISEDVLEVMAENPSMFPPDKVHVFKRFDPAEQRRLCREVLGNRISLYALELISLRGQQPPPSPVSQPKQDVVVEESVKQPPPSPPSHPSLSSVPPSPPASPVQQAQMQEHYDVQPKRETAEAAVESVPRTYFIDFEFTDAAEYEFVKKYFGAVDDYVEGHRLYRICKHLSDNNIVV
ncbi:MAG: ParB/RepB/Spo0J family partition protein [Thermoproteota archaeon]